MKKIWEFTISDDFGCEMTTIERYAEEAAQDYCTQLFCTSEGKVNLEVTKIELNGLPVQKGEKTIVYPFIAWGYENEKSFH